MWICLFSGRHFEETLKNAQWRKVKQMQPMWLCIHSSRQFEDSFENTQWRKVIQMQPVWLCCISTIQFEETFENAQKPGKAKQMQQMWLCICWGPQFEDSFENAHWRKANVTMTKPMQSVKLCTILLQNNWGKQTLKVQSKWTFIRQSNLNIYHMCEC